MWCILSKDNVDGAFWDTNPEIENLFNKQSGSDDFRMGWGGVAEPSIRSQGLEELSNIYPGRGQNPPPVDELPDDMQNFIKSLEDKSPKEKIEAIQAFVLKWMIR